MLQPHVSLCFSTQGAARGVSAPPPGIEPEPPALGPRSLNHWTSREFPGPISCPMFMEKILSLNVTHTHFFFLSFLTHRPLSTLARRIQQLSTMCHNIDLDAIKTIIIEHL